VKENHSSTGAAIAPDSPCLEIPQAVRDLEVRVARSPEQIDEVRQAWSRLSQHRDSDIDFCAQIIWAREGVIRPHVIQVYRDGEPAVLLVGRLERHRMISKIGYLKLPGVAAQALAFPYGGLLGKASSEDCKEIVSSLLASLRDGEADLAILDHLPVGTPFHDYALQIPGFASRDCLAKPEVHYAMTLPMDIKEVYASLSSNHRSDLKRKSKKLLAEHQDKVEVRCYRSTDELEELIRNAEAIARKTYQRGLGVGFQDTDEIRKRLRLAAEKGWLRAYVLFLSGAPAAFWIGDLYRSIFCSDYLAFDPVFTPLSPGTYLLMKTVEEFCATGVGKIDFGFGEARYKEQFGNSPSNEATVLIFSPRAKGMLLNGMRTMTGLAENLVRKTLDRARLLPTLKKFWRSRLANQN